jgi:hypothetical protein
MVDVPDSSQDSNIVGSVDVLRNGFIAGWAFDRTNPDENLVIEVWLGQDLLRMTRADEFRQDLTKLGNGDGRHAFHAAIAEVSPDQYTSLVVHAKSAMSGQSTLLLPAASALGGDPLASDLRKILPATNELKAQLRVIARGQEKLLAKLADPGTESGSTAEDVRTGSLARIEDMLGNLNRTLTALQEHSSAAEVFLLRFDKVLSELDQRVTKLTEPAGRSLLRITLGVTLAVIAALACGLLALVYRYYFSV